MDRNADAAQAPDDLITPFQLDALNVRGRIARLDHSIDAILSQHAYPDAVSGLVAQTVLLAAMIGSAIKIRGRLSLQIRAEGAVRLIAADYFAPPPEGGPARLRAYAGFDPAAAGESPEALLGEGVFGILLDQGDGTSPYQGLTPLVEGGLATSAEIYFAQSEQIATRFALSSARVSLPGQAETWRAGGVMIQHLPQGAEGAAPEAPSGGEALMSADDVAAMTDEGDDWAAAALKLATLESHELLGPVVTPEQLLLRLYHEDAPRIYPPQPARFGCTCSAERVDAALSQYSSKELAHMLTEQGDISADCQFCGALYRFDPETRTAARVG